MDYIFVEFKLPNTRKMMAALESLLKKENFVQYTEGNWLHTYNDELFDRMGPQLDELIKSSDIDIAGDNKEYLMLYISAFAEGWIRSGDDWREIEITDEDEEE